MLNRNQIAPKFQNKWAILNAEKYFTAEQKNLRLQRKFPLIKWLVLIAFNSV